MFNEAAVFNQPLSFDTSRVTAMDYVFSQAAAFNQPLSWDISSVATVVDMFQDAISLSDANKLLIRCAWAGNTAFNNIYASEWSALGVCSPSLPPVSPPGGPAPLKATVD